MEDPSGPGWTGVGSESCDWEPDLRAPMSRAARSRHVGPYRAAIVPPVADVEFRLPPGLVAVAEDAATAVARFDAELGAEIAPFTAVLLRSESVASSKIEHLTASARAIAEAELGPDRRGNAREIVANVRTMEAAVTLADRLDAGAILAMHRVLLDDVDPEHAGRWRTAQVWIGGSDHGPHGAVFVPPHPRHVGPAIDDLVDFVRRDDLPVIAHAALAHAQFETIHPFVDGNGRTGRALLHAHLRAKGLTRFVTVPVSAGLLADTTTYFDALTAYRAGDPRAIVEGVAEASFRAIGNGRTLVDDLRAIRAGWQERVRARRDSRAWMIADLVLRHPVVNARFVADRLGMAVENVYRAIAPLVAAEILVESTDRRRDRVWRVPEVLAALDAFAVRSGRRTPVRRSGPGGRP